MVVQMMDTIDILDVVDDDLDEVMEAGPDVTVYLVTT